MGVVVPDGKEDNFLSANAQEYVVEGVTTVTIESELAGAPEEEKLARVQKLIPLKQIAVGWFLNQYLGDKHGDANAEYGGFSSLTKNGSYEQLNITAIDETSYQFTFRQEVGGKLDLLESLPTSMGEDGRRHFDLTIGKINNADMERLETNNEWYRTAPWDEFDPSTVDASRLDTLSLTIWPEPRSVDAWFDYDKLFADGKVTVGVHFGWDYLKSYHLVHSRSIYNWLVDSEHFTSPVAVYEDYNRNSGPLTKVIHANDKDVTVEVSLYWGKVGTEEDPDTDAGGKVLEQDLRNSLATREVIMFFGHAGPFYGFTMSNWRKTNEGDLDDAEIPFIDMPADTYQIVFAEGCDSYGIGGAFALNPNKPHLENLDLTTLTSFGTASTPLSVMDSLRAVFASDARDQHTPVTFMTWIQSMEDNTYWLNSMYGVHGVDDNPHSHPYASDKLCQPCEEDSDCGGVGNKCTRLNAAEVYCTYFCTADDGCPEGYECREVSVGGMMSSKRCAPKSLTCNMDPGEAVEPTVILNELYVEPFEDANGDGHTDESEDEFVELVNASEHEVDLTGWYLADSSLTRHFFEPGTRVAPGKAIVLFGGGDLASFGSLGDSQVQIASNQLGLSNEGDRLTLIDVRDHVVDEVDFGLEAAWGASFVRDVDGDPNAGWELRATPSAGYRSDGSTF